MKTKQFFITLIYSTLFFACTTDDSVLEQEPTVFEAIEQTARFAEEVGGDSISGDGANSNDSNSLNNSDCIYLPYTIYYPSSPFFYLSDYVYAIIYRNRMVEQRLGTTGCFNYNFPNIRDFKYVNGVYSERIEKNYLDAMAPGGGEDDIEL